MNAPLPHFRSEPFGVVIGEDQPPSNYLDTVLADPEQREAFFALVDREGLVVCKNLTIDPSPYRPVGGKRSQKRLSQGEFFHHDGCSTPVKPRIVEIRCDYQRVVRSMLTATAPFPAVVRAMLLTLPPALRRGSNLNELAVQVQSGEPELPWDTVQGLVNRVIRQLGAEDARSYFADVDAAAGAYVRPWSMGESRFMANNNPEATVQHRRACHPPWRPGTPNGGLLKRWPNEETEPFQ